MRAGLTAQHSSTMLPSNKDATSQHGCPPSPREKVGRFECCPLEMPFLPRLRSGKNRKLVFFLSWCFLFAPVGLGPGEQDSDVHNWGYFGALWRMM